MPAPESWSAPASGGTVADSAVDFNTVTYAGGYWFSVTNVTGSSGNIRARYATDPTGTWTEITMPTAPVGTTSYGFDYASGVVSDGSTWAFLALYSVSGTQTPRIIYASSPSGTWSSYDPSVGTALLESFTYGNGVWALVGRSQSGTPYSPFISTSSTANGTYTAYTSASATGYDTAVIGSFRIQAIRYDGSSQWVTAGLTSTGNEYARYGTTMSPPGSWSAPSSYSGTGALNANRLRYHNSHWTILDNGGRLLASVTDPSGSWTTIDDTTHNMTGYTAEIAWAGDQWVMVGATQPGSYKIPSVAYTSASDPTSGWTTIDANGGGLTGFSYTASTNVNLMGVATDSRYLVAGSQKSGELRYVDMRTAPTILRQRQSPVRTPSRVRGVSLRQRQTPFIT